MGALVAGKAGSHVLGRRLTIEELVTQHRKRHKKLTKLTKLTDR